MKNVPRNKFLICFGPVVDMDSMQLESNNSETIVVDRSENRRALTFVGVKKKKNTKASTTKAPGVTISDTKNSIMIRRWGKKKLSNVIKAVLFEIMLAKRVRDRKNIDQKSCSSKPNFPLSSPEKLLDSSFDDQVLAGKGIQDTISSSTSSCLSSSSSSSLSPSPSSSSSTSNSTQKAKIKHLQSNCNTYSKHQEGEMKPKQGINKGLSSSSNGAIFLPLIISLAATIFCCKFVAILFTSIWLYFLAHKQPTREVNGPGNH